MWCLCTFTVIFQNILSTMIQSFTLKITVIFSHDMSTYSSNLIDEYVYGAWTYFYKQVCKFLRNYYVSVTVVVLCTHFVLHDKFYKFQYINMCKPRYFNVDRHRTISIMFLGKWSNVYKIIYNIFYHCLLVILPRVLVGGTWQLTWIEIYEKQFIAFLLFYIVL